MGPVSSTSARTDERGLYLLTGLRPSTYTIKAEAAGFQRIENRNVVLAVDQQATLNFEPKPVSVNTTVEVTEAPPMLDTDNAALGTDVTTNMFATSLYTTGAFKGSCFLPAE